MFARESAKSLTIVGLRSLRALYCTSSTKTLPTYPSGGGVNPSPMPEVYTYSIVIVWLPLPTGTSFCVKD